MNLLEIDSTLLDSMSVTVAPEQISSDLAGEAVILDLRSGVYYGLNEVGARIWQLLQQSTSIAAIRQTIQQEYEVEAEVCDQDLLNLLQDLQAAGLVEIRHASAA